MDKEFAFPEQEKEPIHDAAHVRNAIARFNQVKGVSDADRDHAWKRILAAAKKFGRRSQREQLARIDLNGRSMSQRGDHSARTDKRATERPRREVAAVDQRTGDEWRDDL
jgi:uncharacterized protein DUF6582